MVLVTLDPLYKSQIEFRNRLSAQGVKVECLEVVGLHMVKDLDLVTEAGRSVRRYVRNMHRL